MTATTDEQRQHTMRVRALRRLSTCEVAGLGIALGQLERVEAELMAAQPKLKAAAQQEANVRHAKGLPPLEGAYVGAYRALVGVLEVVADAREETTYVEVTGKAPRRSRSHR